MHPRSFKPFLSSSCLILLLLAAGCGGDKAVLLAEFAMDDTEGLLDSSEKPIRVDREASHDGGGSLYFFAEEPQKRLLYDVPLEGLSSGKLVWQAYVSTKVMSRSLYFEFILTFEDGKTRFDRVPLSMLYRTVEWVRADAVLTLDPGDVPVSVRLAVYTDGPGHFWLDDMKIWDGLPPDMLAETAEEDS